MKVTFGFRMVSLRTLLPGTGMFCALLQPGVPSAFAQCTNNTLFPVAPVSVSAFNDTVLISNNSNAGQYYQVKNLALNKSYVFTARAGDFITLRNAYTNAVLGSGPAPYTYAVGSGPDVVNVHLNLVSPACGTDATPRTTAVVCTNCTPVGAKTGIGLPNPQATLDVGGEIKLGNVSRAPLAGMVRWNPATSDFEGFNGTKWLSLTKANVNPGQWGQIAATKIMENTRLTVPDGAATDRFGNAVSISGDYAIIGASADDIGTNVNQGSAYIFIRNGTTWTQQAKLTAADGAAGDRFGISVSINGDYVLVGAAFDTVNGNANQGSAYVFVRTGTTWTQQAKITASDGNAGDQFGISVSISGDYALAGANSDDVSLDDDRGSAYVFVRSGTTWAQQAKLTASDAAAGDIFGTSVSISGDYALIGAPYDDLNFPDDNRGSAYMFVRSGSSWASQLKLTALEAASEHFGMSVSLSGNYAVIGAPAADVDVNLNQGKAYIFSRNGSTWQVQPTPITASDGVAADAFGYSVAISGDYIIVGAYNAAGGERATRGAAYIFLKGAFRHSQMSKLITSDGAAGDALGISVGISSDYAIIGASGNDIGNNPDQGSVYFIRKN